MTAHVTGDLRAKRAESELNDRKADIPPFDITDFVVNNRNLLTHTHKSMWSIFNPKSHLNKIWG